ncbi:MAG: radical SAM protein [Promethearchaeota archaeon]
MHEAMLYNKLADKKVGCYLCSRRCTIAEGKLGYCQVRKNEKGTLYSLVYGKACSANPDPIEKKPLWHFHPGSMVMSVATVGCNFRCQFCFHPETTIISNGIPQKIQDLFASSEKTHNENIRIVKNAYTNSATGKKRKIRKVFCHNYEGELIEINGSYLPPLECTPEHEIYVWNGAITTKKAEDIRVGDLLIVPKMISNETIGEIIEIAPIIGKSKTKIKKSRITDEKKLKEIMKLREMGLSSREIGKHVGMHPTYLRKLMKKIEREGITEKTFYYTNDVKENEGNLKFRSEKGWIPARISMNEEFAELLGYYVAEGWVTKDKNRPNSFQVSFSYGHEEEALAERTVLLLKKIFGVTAIKRIRRTTIAVEVNKSSLGVLFKQLCGTSAKSKKVPNLIFKSPKNVILSFLKAYIKGDGTETGNNIAINTISKKLSVGVYFLLLKLGYLPGWYEWEPPEKKKIEGRLVHQSTLYYVKVNTNTFGRELVGGSRKKPDPDRAVAFRSYKDFWLLPVKAIDRKPYSGPVYNMEVEDEHSYIANFIGVGNCQNWQISHEREIVGRNISPEKLVEYALDTGCTGVSYTYTEPTIFFEYAYDTAKIAQEHGLFNTFVTNGYMTTDAIETIAPYLDAATVDFKGNANPAFYKNYCNVNAVDPIFDALKAMKAAKIHIEITNLLVSDVGDDTEEAETLAQWIVQELGEDTPLHLLRFYPHHKMSHLPPTPIKKLEAAAAASSRAGLKYVYLGNVPGHQGANTICHNCGALLVERLGIQTISVRLTRDGRCPSCNLPIPITLAEDLSSSE